MHKDKRIVSPGPGKVLIGEEGERLTPPPGWEFLPAGDAGVTRKVTARGKFWRVQVTRGRRKISKGIWAPAEAITRAQQEMKATRSTEHYKKKLEAGRRQREKKQSAYEKEFFQAVSNFLSFAPRYKDLEAKFAAAVTRHAVPVSSGTVARTTMIPIEERAARAVIAWMRHKTTAYDSIQVPRIKGRRREIRQMLAKHSSGLLRAYRRGDILPAGCPLKQALESVLVE